MNSKSRVSVIMIFLNCEKYIDEAIGSVLAQTYDCWELLLVDDGSTDKSSDIAQRYAQTYPEKVRYLEHENHANCGMSASRNLGIISSQGEYIAFLDADDIWLSLKLEKQVAILDKQPEAGMVYGATFMWYSWTDKPTGAARDSYRKLGVQSDSLIKPPTLPIEFLRKQADTPATCGVLIRREVIEAVGGFEPMFRGMFEDQVFFYKVCLQTSVFVESGSWDKYRQHPDSASRVAMRIGKYHRHDLNPAQLKFLEWLKSYLHQAEIKDIEIHQALQELLRPYYSPIYFFYRIKGLSKHILRQKLPKLIN